MCKQFYLVKNNQAEPVQNPFEVVWDSVETLLVYAWDEADARTLAEIYERDLITVDELYILDPVTTEQKPLACVHIH